MEHYITPHWPAPINVHAYTTTRQGGVSIAPYNSFNLGDHVGDQDNAVMINRDLLSQQLQLPNPPYWLQQVHGNTAVQAKPQPDAKAADASYSQHTNIVCGILTADCLPILLTCQQASFVAAIHAGWRSLSQGIIENTLAAINTRTGKMLAWLGPAISQACYEVGPEVQAQFVNADPAAKHAFKPSDRAEHYFADLYLLAKQRLINHGITQIYGGNFCTYTDHKHFFSYRRDNTTGRMLSLIWLS